MSPTPPPPHPGLSPLAQALSLSPLLLSLWPLAWPRPDFLQIDALSAALWAALALHVALGGRRLTAGLLALSLLWSAPLLSFSALALAALPARGEPRPALAWAALASLALGLVLAIVFGLPALAPMAQAQLKVVTQLRGAGALFGGFVLWATCTLLRRTSAGPLSVLIGAALSLRALGQYAPELYTLLATPLLGGALGLAALALAPWGRPLSLSLAVALVGLASTTRVGAAAAALALGLGALALIERPPGAPAPERAAHWGLSLGLLLGALSAGWFVLLRLPAPGALAPYAVGAVCVSAVIALWRSGPAPLGAPPSTIFALLSVGLLWLSPVGEALRSSYPWAERASARSRPIDDSSGDLRLWRQQQRAARAPQGDAGPE